MPMISLNEAASRLGLSLETIEEWANKGLLHVHTVVKADNLPPPSVGHGALTRQVDEDELGQLAESLGWLQLSAEDWDSDEGQ